MSESRKGSIAETPPDKKPIIFSRKVNVYEKLIDLDDILVNELGQFGRFQMRNLLLVAFPIIMSGFASEYIFSAAAIPHRCQIPECGEDNSLVQFETNWSINAIPEATSGFSSCERFAPRSGVTNGTLDNCPNNLFDSSLRIKCDGFVYAKNNTVVYDFDLGCQEWLRALAGTLGSIGDLLSLPITGYISDRYGRRLALTISGFNLAFFGFIRAFSVNYPMYLFLQILQKTLGGGTYSSAYIFATELVGPKYRVLTGASSSSMFALGLIILGGVAWLLQAWRYMIIALFVPCLLIISYYWILSESVRWLLSKQRYEEARKFLEKVATINKKQISEKSLNSLMNPPPRPASQTDQGVFGLIKTIISSRKLLRRVCTTPIWWITTTLVYYGLSINSIGLSDTMYLNFILTSAIEIPGFYTAALVLDRIGRKPTLSIGYFLCAGCNIAFAFIPKDLDLLRLIIYLLGKFCISAVVTSVYLYTSELYPTEYRHTLLAFSSMIGRIGSITAPLTPVLLNIVATFLTLSSPEFRVGADPLMFSIIIIIHMVYWEGIPSVMFGAMALLSGALVLTQPETLGSSLPDTLAEAEAIGKSDPKIQES